MKLKKIAQFFRVWRMLCRRPFTDADSFEARSYSGW